jgi:hypothetical protein
MLLLAANVELALEGERDRSSEIQSRNFSVSEDESRLRPGNLKVASVEDASVMLSAFRRNAKEPLSDLSGETTRGLWKRGLGRSGSAKAGCPLLTALCHCLVPPYLLVQLKGT